MKRLLPALLICLLPDGPCFGQAGVQIGWNISKYKYEYLGDRQDRSSIFGLNAGFLYRGHLTKSLSLQPSLLFTRKGTRNYNTPIGSYDEYYNNKLNYLQLTLPVLYSVNMGVKHYTLDFGAGPYTASLLSAKLRTRDLNGNDEKADYKIGTDFKRMDAGMSVILGARLRRVNTYLQYDLGMSDVDPTSNGKIRNRCFSLNFAVMFGDH